MTDDGFDLVCEDVQVFCESHDDAVIERLRQTLQALVEGGKRVKFLKCSIHLSPPRDFRR